MLDSLTMRHPDGTKYPLSIEFSRYWKALDPKQKEELAERCNTSVAYLSQIANGDRDPSLALAAQLASETGISRRKLRPDVVEWMRA